MQPSNQDTPAVLVFSSHRLAATAMAEFLTVSLQRRVAAVSVAQPELAAQVAVLNAVFEPPAAIPSLIGSCTGRVIVVYDPTTSAPGLLETAQLLSVFSVFDIRQDPEVLVNQVTSALSGRAWAEDRVDERWRAALEHRAGSGLTAREIEVIDALFASPDATPASVAASLGLSTNTVRVHLSNVRRKLGDRFTGNRAALHAALLDRGWLER